MMAERKENPQGERPVVRHVDRTTVISGRNLHTLMDWSSLLCRKRLRYILDGKGSTSGEDHRTEFEKDYDRVVYSTPFRRLQDKAQVFPLESHDAVHTRLAHSMEVARVAKGLAQKVGEDVISENEEEVGEEEVQHIATIAEVAGLVHDFGNPPFGHAGEEAMRDWFRSLLLKEDGKTKFENEQDLEPQDFSDLGRTLWDEDPQYVYDFLRFDGNAHTVRLLSRLQVVAHYRGLNLTAATMAAALKYIPPSHEANGEDHLHDKPGYLASEEDVVEKVREVTGLEDNRHPITVLVEAADDIVNSLIDLEDALRKGELTWTEIADELKSRMEDEDSLDQFEDLKEEAEKVVDEGDAELNEDRGEACLRMFRTFAIGKHVKAVSDKYEEKYDAIVEGSYSCEILTDDTDTSELAEACEGLKFDRVIPSRDVIKLEYMGRNVMQDLMEMFWEGAQEAPNPESDFNKKIYNLSSQNYRSVFENTGTSLPREYKRLQLVADQVCGMTDSYACQLHRELTNG